MKHVVGENSERNKGQFALTGVFLLLSILLLFIEAAFVPLHRYGDSYEYLYMTRAFQNHLSPDVRGDDIASLQNVLQENQIRDEFSLDQIFYTSKTGKLYSFHFWTYSLFCMPAMALLDSFHQNILRTFPIMNTLFYLVALWCVFLGLNCGRKRRLLLFLFLGVNPVIWYLMRWTPEVLCFSLVTISLVLYYRNHYTLAILMSALAATQNPPIIFVSAFYLIKWGAENHSHLLNKSLPGNAAAFVPFIIPNLFYWINFGTPNLLIKYHLVGVEFITFKKAVEFIFDLNLGIFPYMPVLVFLFLVVALKSLFTMKRDPFPALMFGVVCLMILTSIETSNWNNDIAGMNRYAVWTIPVMIFMTVMNGFESSWVMKAACISGIVIQGIILVYFGGLMCTVFYLRLSQASIYLLDHFPQLYSPTPEIFIERVSEIDDPVADPHYAIYASQDGDIRKAYGDANTLQKLIGMNHRYVEITDEYGLEQALQELERTGGKQYINFSKGTIWIKPDYLQADRPYQNLILP